MINAKNIIPFSNATDYQCWLSANCEKCRKYHEDLDNRGYSKCEIEGAIALSSCGEGLTEEMIKRMGGVQSTTSSEDYNFFHQKCTEMEAIK